MLSRAFRVAATVTRIGELKARLSLAAFRQAGVTTVGYGIAALLAMVSVCGFLGAGYIVLSRVLQPAEALAVISGVGLGFSSLIWLAAYLNSRTKVRNGLRVQIEEEEKLLRSTIGIAEPDNDGSGKEEQSVNESSPPAFTRIDPKVVAAAGFAVAGLLGPVRVIRLIRIGVGVGSAAALIKRAVREHQDAHEDVEVGSSPPSTPQTPKPTPVKQNIPHNGAVPRRSGGDVATSER